MPFHLKANNFLIFVPYLSVDSDIQVVKVKEAWAEVPSVQHVVRRKKKKKEDNLNNNDDEEQNQKRRSFHPQEHLSNILDHEQENRARNRRRRPKDFPKVINVMDNNVLD